MRKKHEPSCGWLGRLLRGRRFDRNPLRRTSDRAETAIVACALIALLAGGPFAALAGGDFAHNLALANQQTQRATERQVSVVTVESAPRPQQVARLAYPGVLARWTAPNGKQVTDEITVRAGTPIGTRELAWTTFTGQLAAPPLLDSQVDDLTTLGQATSVVALVVALTLGWAGVRRGLNHRRLAAWDAEWQAVDHRRTRRT